MIIKKKYIVTPNLRCAPPALPAADHRQLKWEISS